MDGSAFDRASGLVLRYSCRPYALAWTHCGSGPPPESHPGLIVFVLIGVFITLLGILQTIFFVQGSEKLTRFSLWLNFLAIFCLGLAAFGTKWIEGPLDFIVLVATE